VDVVFSFLEAFPRQNTFALFVNLEHVKLGLFSIPAKHLLENVGDVMHIIDGIVPADDQVPRFKARFGLLLRFFYDTRSNFWCGSLHHRRRIKAGRAVVQRPRDTLQLGRMGTSLPKSEGRTRMPKAESERQAQSVPRSKETESCGTESSENPRGE